MMSIPTLFSFSFSIKIENTHSVEVYVAHAEIQRIDNRQVGGGGVDKLKIRYDCK